jgi:hypothetical protein
MKIEHFPQRGKPQPKGITTDFTDGTDKDFSIREIREIRGKNSPMESPICRAVARNRGKC